MNEQPSALPPQQHEGQSAAPVQPQTQYQPQPTMPAEPVYSPAQAPVQPPAVTKADGVFAWQTSEYDHQEKGALWLLGYVAIIAGLVAIAWFLAQSITFVVVVLAMGISLGVLAFRPPRLMNYSISSRGVQINDKHYSFGDFKAFGIVHNGPRFTAMLIPTKRLMPLVTMMFDDENQGEKIVDLLGVHLPMQPAQEAFIDKVLQRLRF